MKETTWEYVPFLVQDLFVKYAAHARALQKQAQNHPEGWIMETEEVGPVLIKRAEGFWSGIRSDGVFKSMGKGMDYVQKAVGGPNPLTAMLLGGALVGLPAYGAGWLANKLAPEYIGRNAGKKWGILGALAGIGIPGLIHAYPNVKELGIKGLVTPTRFQGRKGPPGPPPEEYIMPEAADRNPVLDTVLERLIAKTKIQPAEKQAAGFVDMAMEASEGAGGGYLPSLPTDQWGRVVLHDPFLSPAEKGVAVGLPYATAARTGRSIVSPVEVGQMAANTAFGGATGYTLGMLGNVLFDWQPKTVDLLSRSGLLAGAIRGALNMIG